MRKAMVVGARRIAILVLPLLSGCGSTGTFIFDGPNAGTFARPGNTASANSDCQPAGMAVLIRDPQHRFQYDEDGRPFLLPQESPWVVSIDGKPVPRNGIGGIVRVLAMTPGPHRVTYSDGAEIAFDAKAGAQYVGIPTRRPTMMVPPFGVLADFAVSACSTYSSPEG